MKDEDRLDLFDLRFDIYVSNRIPIEFRLPSFFRLHPSSFIPHPSSIILHPSSLILHPSSFILPDARTAYINRAPSLHPEGPCLSAFVVLLVTQPADRLMKTMRPW